MIVHRRGYWDSAQLKEIHSGVHDSPQRDESTPASAPSRGGSLRVSRWHWRCNGCYLGHDRSLRCHIDGPHAGADLYDYKPYLPSRLHDDFDGWAKTYVSPFDDLIIATAQRNWDHELRMSEMDADGVAAEVLLPNTVPPFFPTTPNTTITPAAHPRGV